MADDGVTIRNTDHQIRYPWPEDMFIQGGSSGLVIVRGGENYGTAFVEAFPRTPPTFLRGEGPTLAEAEDDCWRKYQTYLECPHGEYERRGYTNGSGFCVSCGLWMNKVFKPLENPDEL